MIEGEEPTTSMPPAIILNKSPSEITLEECLRFYHGPKGVFLCKTLEEDTILPNHESLLNSVQLLSEADHHDTLHPYHWTVVTDYNSQVPSCGASGILIKVRPFQTQKNSHEEDKEREMLSFMEGGYLDLHPSSPPQRNKKGSRDEFSPGTIYACSFSNCTKTFNKPWRLKSHIRNHTGEKKPHACRIPGCGKSFNESHALKNHLRVHTGEKPFICSFEGCAKHFTEKGNLRKHMRIHTGEKPYVCAFDGCGRSFGRSDQLRVHSYEHTGIKPFICEFEGCGKAFSYSSGLKVHQKIHRTRDKYADISSMEPGLISAIQKLPKEEGKWTNFESASVVSGLSRSDSDLVADISPEEEGLG